MSRLSDVDSLNAAATKAALSHQGGFLFGSMKLVAGIAIAKRVSHAVDALLR